MIDPYRMLDSIKDEVFTLMSESGKPAHILIIVPEHNTEAERRWWNLLGTWFLKYISTDYRMTGEYYIPDPYKPNHLAIEPAKSLIHRDRTFYFWTMTPKEIEQASFNAKLWPDNGTDSMLAVFDETQKGDVK